MKVVNIKYIVRTIAVMAMVIFSAGSISAQQSPLNREVTLHAPGIAVKDALLLLGEESMLNFSYNSALIDNDKKISVNADHEKLGSVLDEILDNDIQYKVVGNHIVLLADNTVKVKEKEVKKSGYAITGTIYDATSGQVIRSASIYDVDGERSSLTNNEGFYSILVPANDDFKGLTYCKDGYLDTVIIVQPADDLYLDMHLRPIVKKVIIAEAVDPETDPELVLEKPTFNENRFVDAMIPAEALSHSDNLQLYNRKIGQVSFLPFPGTHTSRNGLYVNRFSLNILAGYSGGVEGIEVGGLLNVDRNYVNGIQVAGLGNIVGKKTQGIQVAGLTNINVGSIVGVQVAGFNNVTNDTITGVQVAGFTNYLRGAMNGVQVSGFYNHLARGAYGAQLAGFVNYAGMDFRGLQAAGFVNVAIDSINGLQAAGFANYQRGEMKGAQVAGFANISFGGIDGVQVAGFANLAVEADSGIQVAGFMNVALQDYEGVQVAGFLNRAEAFSGLQVGTFNFSAASDGYSIGIFNHVQQGYRAIEFSADEVLLANLTYKTGNNKLYNVWNLGVDPVRGGWGVGFGFGSYTNLGEKFHLFVDLTANAINENAVWESNINLLNKFTVGLDYQLTEKLALFAAPSFNVHVSGIRDVADEFDSKIAFHPFYENSGTYVLTQMWIGGKFGVRLVLNEGVRD